MKTTSTLFEIIKSELIKSGKNEFFNGNQLTFFDDNFSFIKKIMFYDSDVESIVTKKFFLDYKFTSNEAEKNFKKAFVNRFMNREIGTQTLESFATQVVYVTLTHEKYINEVYENMEKYLHGQAEQKGTGKENNLSDYRTATAELPQNDVNVNVDDFELEYADNNTISRTRYKSDKEDEQTNNNYDIDTLEKLFPMFDRILVEYDKKCFLQVW